VEWSGVVPVCRQALSVACVVAELRFGGRTLPRGLGSGLNGGLAGAPAGGEVLGDFGAAHDRRGGRAEHDQAERFGGDDDQADYGGEDLVASLTGIGVSSHGDTLMGAELRFGAELWFGWSE
jgi:hypothetical protein